MLNTADNPIIIDNIIQIKPSVTQYINLTGEKTVIRLPKIVINGNPIIMVNNVVNKVVLVEIYLESFIFSTCFNFSLKFL